VKTWKEGEKRIAAWYSESGHPATRRSTALRGEAVEDIEWGWFSIEVKTRKTVPQYVHEWMEQALRNAELRTPVIHWHQDRQHLDDDYVVMRAKDFRRWVSLILSVPGVTCDSD